MTGIRLTRSSVVWSCLIAFLILCSCESFLEVELPKAKIEKAQAFDNDITADQAVLGIYSYMVGADGFANGDNLSISTLSGLSSDELVNYPRNQTDIPEFDENDLRAQNEVIFRLWASLYKTIYFSNAVVEGLNKSNSISLRLKDQLLGEALFIRAFCHFYLVNIYGDIPLIVSTSYDENSLVSRTSVPNVYEQVKNDLLMAKLLLTNNYYGSKRIRPDKSAASAMLARLYLYLGQWENAELEATEVLNAGFILAELDEVFLANSTEAIWQLRPGVVQNNSELGYTGEAYYFTPPTVLQYNVLRSELISSFETGDQRFNEWVRKYTTVYHPYKYRQNDATKELTEYSMIIRLAEVILIRAEARANLDNILGINSAESDINSIRDRAGLGAITATTKDQMLSAIEQERRVELFTEWGHRWFDLKRRDRADAILDPLKIKWSSIDVLYPIPQKERNNNPNLNPQNPGY